MHVHHSDFEIIDKGPAISNEILAEVKKTPNTHHN
jgi:hypothetical protein